MNLTIPGEPVPKQRPRKGQHGNFYTPRETKTYEETIAWSTMSTTGGSPGRRIEGPVAVDMVVYTSNRKLDLDNVLKAVADGLNGFAYKDDRQICEVHLKRVWSPNPRVEITIQETEEQQED